MSNKLESIQTEAKSMDIYSICILPEPQKINNDGKILLGLIEVYNDILKTKFYDFSGNDLMKSWTNAHYNIYNNKGFGISLFLNYLDARTSKISVLIQTKSGLDYGVEFIESNKNIERHEHEILIRQSYFIDLLLRKKSMYETIMGIMKMCDLSELMEVL